MSATPRHLTVDDHDTLRVSPDTVLIGRSGSRMQALLFFTASLPTGGG